MEGCPRKWGHLTPTRQLIKNYISSKKVWHFLRTPFKNNYYSSLFCRISWQYILKYKKTLLFCLSFQETWLLLMIFWSQLKMPHHLLQEAFLHPHQEGVFVCASKAVLVGLSWALNHILPSACFLMSLPLDWDPLKAKNTSFLVNQFCPGNSLAVQWLGCRALTAEGPSSIPGQGTKIPQALQHGQRKKKICPFLLLSLHS